MGQRSCDVAFLILAILVALTHFVSQQFTQAIQPETRISICRVHLAGALKVSIGARQAAPFLMDEAQVIVNVGRGRVKLNSAFIRRNGFVLLLWTGRFQTSQIGSTQIAPKHYIVWMMFHGRFEHCHSAVPLALQDQSAAQIDRYIRPILIRRSS
jgi:hypothetical protein